jgi:hypothetical protein
MGNFTLFLRFRQRERISPETGKKVTDDYRVSPFSEPDASYIHLPRDEEPITDYQKYLAINRRNKMLGYLLAIITLIVVWGIISFLAVIM